MSKRVTLDDAKFRKIYKTNSWGHITYHLSKKCNDESLKFKDKQKLTIKFKNGDVAVAPVYSFTEYEHINDIGHEYDVSSLCFSIKENVNGHTVFIPIEEVKIYFSDKGRK